MMTMMIMIAARRLSINGGAVEDFYALSMADTARACPFVCLFCLHSIPRGVVSKTELRGQYDAIDKV
jgi:hypothetical protein